MTTCERPVAVNRGCHPSTGTNTLTGTCFPPSARRVWVMADSPGSSRTAWPR
jgi:hypothetical protein